MRRFDLLLALGIGGALTLSACADRDERSDTAAARSAAESGQDQAAATGSVGGGPVQGAAGGTGGGVQSAQDPAAQAALGNRAANATLSMAQNEGGTPYVADGAGGAVYILAGNTDGSRCDAACEAAWPPVLAIESRPEAGQGLDGSLIGTFDRNGRTQVTYGGEPLYRYAGDAGANRTAGAGVEDQWGKWSLVGLDGQPIDDPR